VRASQDPLHGQSRLYRAPLVNAEASQRGAGEPEVNTDRILEATGRGKDDWCDLIDAWPRNTEGHTAIATHVREDHGIDGWWAQMVTVGYERITGRRVPYQRADGTFSLGKTRTVTFDGAELRAMLLDEDGRRDLFPLFDTTLRSKPTTKVLRIGLEIGTALFTISPATGGRTSMNVTHDGLTRLEDVELWKQFWSDWLEALDEEAAER
jgi:hypothetical protein